MNIMQVEETAKRIRRNIVDISHFCNTSTHIGGALSMADIMAVLYQEIMNYEPSNTLWEKRDRFILSKGHAAVGLYSVLYTMDIITEETFSTFQKNGSDLTTHPVMKMSLGIESSNGSLGQGLSMGVGLALAAKKQGKQYKTYVMLGNGECNEGAVWEASMSAAMFGLDNLTAIIDNNGYQNDGDSAEIMDTGNVEKKWDSFGWDVCSIDGHDISAIHSAFIESEANGKPKAIIAGTVKGKGVPFMEGNNEWHHNRLTKRFYEQALLEMGAI
jgi:transketolase